MLEAGDGYPGRAEELLSLVNVFLWTETQDTTLSSLCGFQMKGDKATPVVSFIYCNLKQEKYRKVSFCLTKA